jgi:hypothetical protein
MENPKLNWCIRFSLEIIVVIAGVALYLAQSSPTTGAAETTPPVQESPGKRPGAGRNLATITLAVEPDQVSFQNQNHALADLSRLSGETSPDQIVIKLHGASWKTFFNWAIQNDKPVCIIADE